MIRVIPARSRLPHHLIAFALFFTAAAHLLVFVFRARGPRAAFAPVGIPVVRGYAPPAFFREPDLRKRYHTPVCMEFAAIRLGGNRGAELEGAVAFLPEAFGGIGDQFAALVRGLFLCYIFACERLCAGHFALPLPLDDGGFNTTDGIRVLRDAPPGPAAVPVNSFEVDVAPECLLDDVAIAATVRGAVLRTLPAVDVNASTLYICARGGELMERNTPFYWHGQPPCQYYRDAMRIDAAPRTVVMSNRDKPSPCVAQLLARGAVYVSAGEPVEDFARFIHARRIVVSRTSFTTAIMLLSEPKDALYAFRTRHSMCIWPRHSRLHDDYERFGRHYRYRATNEYDARVLQEWHATDEQMEIMKTTNKGCTWEYG
jgi:hypothetical protein